MTDASWYPEAEELRELAPRHVLFLCVANSCSEPAGGGDRPIARATGSDRLVGGIAAVPGEPASPSARSTRSASTSAHTIEEADSILPEGVEAVITSAPRRSARCSSGRRGVHWGLPILPLGRRKKSSSRHSATSATSSAVACPSSSAADHARGNPHVQGPGLRSPDVLLHGRVRPPGRSRARAAAADLEWPGANGVAVERFNLSQEPAAFVGNPVVAQAIRGRDDALRSCSSTARSPCRAATPRARCSPSSSSGSPRRRRRKGQTRAERPRRPCPTRSAVRRAPRSAAEGEMDLVRLATRHLFFTGKGGVGKTPLLAPRPLGSRTRASASCSSRRTPPPTWTRCSAPARHRPVAIPGVPSLHALNLDPEAAARAYRERVVGLYRGLRPPAAVRSMEEQLSGACTVEIAAFDEFARPRRACRDRGVRPRPLRHRSTGHTPRLLTLPPPGPGSWSRAQPGTSCLGPSPASRSSGCSTTPP